MTRPKDWTAGSVAVAVAAASVAVGAGWALWAVSPVAATLTATHAGLAGLCVLAATRNLRARLEATQQVVDAWNSSEARDELAKSPAAGTSTVDDPEPPEWMDQSGYRPPRTLATGSVGGWVDLTDKVQSIEITKGPPPGHTGDPAWSRGPMTPAETDRLIANLHALPGEDVSTPDPTPLPITGDQVFTVSIDPEFTAITADDVIAALPDGSLTVDGTFSDSDPRFGAKTNVPADHIGMPCRVCDAPATGWTCVRTTDEDGWVEDYTFLCDDHYAAAMAEEGDRG